VGVTSTSFEGDQVKDHGNVSQLGGAHVKKIVLTQKAEVDSVSRSSSSTRRSAMWRIKKTKYVKNWLPQFMSFVHHHKKNFSTLSVKERHKLVRTFCTQHFSTYEERFYRTGTSEEKRLAWKLACSLSHIYPEIAVQDFGLGFGSKKNLLIIDEVTKDEHHMEAGHVHQDKKRIVISMLQASPKLGGTFEDVLLLENGEIVYHGSAGSILEYFQELGFVCPAGVDVYDFLLGLGATESHYQVTVTKATVSDKSPRHTKNAGALLQFADDVLFVAGAPVAASASSESKVVAHESVTTSASSEMRYADDVFFVSKVPVSSVTKHDSAVTVTETTEEVVYTTEGTKTVVAHHTTTTSETHAA
jgi:hypothetical protein